MYTLPYNETYHDDVERICLSTSSARDDEHRLFTLELYCRPYLELNDSFILQDNNKTIGYILCASNPDVFDQTMIKHLSILREVNPQKAAGYEQMLSVYHAYPEYPAHLHIDILEECTHGGGGTMLMNTLCEHLKSKNIPGVMLIVDARNIRAVSFYKKNGFDTLKDLQGAYIMGKKLQQRK